MTTEPNAFAVRLAGGIPKLRLDGDIGDPVALLVIGHIAADGLRATATGTTRTVGVKLEEAVPVDGEHADQIRKAVNRATRAREAAAKGLEVVPELAPGTVDGDAPTVDEAVDAFLNAETMEDPLLSDTPLVETTSMAPASILERAWVIVDNREPGYADLGVKARRERALRRGVTSAPFVLRAFLLLEELELDDGTGDALELRDDLKAAIEEGLERYLHDEPWHGYDKATVKAIVGHLDGTLGNAEGGRHVDIARGNWPGVVEHVLIYERAHKVRASIVNAALDAAEATGVIIPGEDAA
jgi:hypothetical protein